MRKKVVSILLIATLLLQFSIISFAAEPEVPADEYKAAVSLQVRRSGASSWTDNLTKSANEKMDFKAVVDKEAIHNAITEWYDYAIDTIEAINDEEIEADMMTKLAAREINGEFKVKISFSNKFEGNGINEIKDGSDMDGFNEEASQIFYESAPREYSKGVLTITLGLKSAADATKKLTVGELCGTGSTVDADLLDSYIPDLEFATSKVQLVNSGKHKVSGYLEGSIDFFALGESNVVKFVGDPNPADVYVTVRSTGGQGSTYTPTTPDNDNNNKTDTPNTPETGNNTGTVTKPSANVNFGGSTDDSTTEISKSEEGTIQVDSGSSTNYGSIAVPSKEGYVFTGWYADADLTERHDDSDVAYSGSKVYAGWAKTDLDMSEHSAYVLGYPDGTVRPENTITREEVTAIFYRLLLDEKRADITTTDNSFNDVDAERWSNEAISSAARGGYINGYENGDFAPEGAITRAEFAAIATRFVGLSDVSEVAFADVEGHWASAEISKAAQVGWITGYENGTFMPDNYITRAEAMAIINRMLSRNVNANGIHANAKQWSDNNPADWYYYIVLEATNSHTYTKAADGRTEVWSSVLAD